MSGPLSAAKLTEITNADPDASPATATSTRTPPSAITDAEGDSPDGGEVTALLDLGDAYDTMAVEFTYDIVDKYEADEADEDKSYPEYTSGYGRALLTSSSDSRGAFVDLDEVAAIGSETGDPTSNIFRGVVNITNVPGADTDMYVYVQDGDTLTLTVLSKDGDRNSSVLASATVLVDDSKPSVDDLTPADKEVTSDDKVAINFTINDSGAGLDLVGRNNVNSVSVFKRGDEGKSTGEACALAKEAAEAPYTRSGDQELGQYRVLPVGS